jgi:glycine/D-amino acid oxidase-like deaminating enzyme
MNTKFEYIIVGQGIAGSMVAHTLLSRGKNVLVIDEFHSKSSSNIASGVVNPITGRKMVKTWMIDEILPFAKQTYKNLEVLLQAQFVHENKLLKIFSSNDDIEQWKKRQADVAYAPYMGDMISPEDIHPSINAPFGAGIIKQAFGVSVPEFTKATRVFLKSQNRLLEEHFEYDKLQISDTLQYKNIEADKIIFCEGYKAYQNPFFKWIPFCFAKGEQLLIHSEKLETNSVLNKNIFVIPIGNHLFKVGSTFIWDDMEEKVTDAGREEILQKYKKISGDEFTIVEESAAIRPAMRDRRPVVGRHPEHQNLFVFNGMGTKGVSLTPYFSNYLADFLEQNFKILPEISMDRF